MTQVTRQQRGDELIEEMWRWYPLAMVGCFPLAISMVMIPVGVFSAGFDVAILGGVCGLIGGAFIYPMYAVQRELAALQRGSRGHW